MIRGVGTMNDAGPLILVDGMEMSLNEVNPNDVASISILKDAASCAIYGNRGANGVILVTTKRGSDGKINVTYSGKFSYQTPAKLIRQVTDYADYMEFVNEGYLNTNQAAKFSQSTINEWREAANNPNATNVAGIPNYVTHPNTDWYDVVYDPKWMQEHTISLTGAEKRTNYAISGTYLNNPGLVIESGVKKYYLRSDIESRVTDFLTVGMRAWGYNADQDRNNLGDMWGLNMQKVTPGVYPYYDGKYGGIETNEEDGQAGNPLLNMSNSYGYYKQNKYFVNPYIEVKFLKDFKFTANFYYDQFTNHHRWQPSDYKEQYSFNRTMTLSTPPTSTDMATYKVYDWERREKYWKTNMLVSWAHTYGKHDVGALIGYEESRNWGDEVDICKEGMSSVNLTDFDAMTDPYYIKGSSYEYSSRSWFGRINYAFDNRYLFEMNMRYDGSSRFAKGHRWGFFPSFSAGYDIARTPYFQQLALPVSQLKVRVSYGRLGNQNGAGLYDYIAQMPLDAQGTNAWLLPGISSSTASKGTIAKTPKMISPYITWEKVDNANLGFDLMLLKNRLSITADFYQRTTRDMIGPAESIPSISGIASDDRAKVNNATLRNRGWELSVSWNDKLKCGFSYGIGFNVFNYKAVVTKYNNPEGIIYNNHTGLAANKGYYEGMDIGEIWGYRADDLFLSNREIDDYLRNVNLTAFKSNDLWRRGDLKYIDSNGDGRVDGGKGTLADHGDLQIIGNTTPKYSFGINLNLGYKGFEISTLLQGVAKRDFPISGSNYMFGGNNYNFKEHLDYFSTENPNGYLPRLTGWKDDKDFLVNTGYNTTRYLLNAAYMRMKNLTVGYTFNKKQLRHIGISNLKVYVTCDNLFTVTKLPKQFDPETLNQVNMSAGGDAQNTAPGLTSPMKQNGNGMVYPMNRNFVFGLDFTF